MFVRKLFTKNCVICNSGFFTRHKETTTCSRKCSGISRTKQISLVCVKCGKAFTVISSRAKKARFCGVSCSKASEFVKSCLVCKKEFKIKSYLLDRRKTCSVICRITLQQKTEERNCLHCNKSFLPPANSSKYCSRACGDLTRVTKILLNCENCGKEFQAQKREADSRRNCSRSCLSQSRAKKGKTACVCAYCGKSFDTHNCRLENIKFCSWECKKNSGGGVDKKCERCGKDFHVLKKRVEKARFCSMACRFQGGIPEKSCKNCGKIFKPSLKTVECCSRTCAARILAPILSQKFSQKIPKICKKCNKTFSVSPSASIQQFCSMICAGNNVRQPAGFRIARAVYHHKRREKERKNGGVFTLEQWKDKVNYFGNRCYLCGKSLVNEQVHIEHRIPVSRGGTNWVSNLAPACASCNHSKHNKTEKEFRALRQNQSLPF